MRDTCGKAPKDIVERGQAYDLSQGGDGLRIRTLSAISLAGQIASDGATWLDRQIIAVDRSEIRDSGFGREVNKAISRRARRLVKTGLATVRDGNVRVPADTVTTLQRQEVNRVGNQMARGRGLTYVPANAGEYVSGRLAGATSLVSRRFAMIENGLGFRYSDCWLVVYLNIDEWGVRQREIEQVITEMMIRYSDHFQEISVLWKGKLYSASDSAMQGHA